MVTKQVPQGGLLIDSMRDFKRSISACNAGIPLSIEEDEGRSSLFSRVAVIR